ncbi:MAG: hypothetical protein JWO07_185 [Candidatus Saccharibacteria bacterium]|nr:hypothetical protein [Candidatus Saccharibacteria bacterium]
MSFSYKSSVRVPSIREGVSYTFVFHKAGDDGWKRAFAVTGKVTRYSRNGGLVGQVWLEDEGKGVLVPDINADSLVMVFAT